MTTLMRASQSKHQFEELFERAYPPTHGVQEQLPLTIDVTEPPEETS